MGLPGVDTMHETRKKMVRWIHMGGLPLGNGRRNWRDGSTGLPMAQEWTFDLDVIASAKLVHYESSARSLPT